MKADALLDASTAAALRFDWLLRQLEPVSEYGRERFADVRAFARGEEAAASSAAHAIVDASTALDAQRVDALRETLRAAPDAAGALARANLGETLTDVNLFEMLRFCDTVARVRGLAGDASVPVPPDCAAVARALERGRSGKFGFYLGDEFDSELATQRALLAAEQAEYDTQTARLHARIANELGRPDTGGGEFIVMRDDLRGALPAGLHVIREAPTYYLCEVDLDERALAALERRDDAAARVAEMEVTVRATLSARIREHGPMLHEAAEKLGALDVLLAAVRFTQQHACAAAVYDASAGVTCESAHFLPLEDELVRQDRSYVPISLQLERTAVLTGPNMGGKSVALRTCGFVALCAAFGLPVPAASARVALFDRIVWLGIGPAEEPQSLLSSFAGEVVRLRDALAAGVANSLLLVDEFARTTTPEEGRALLLALLERLERDGARALVATHLSGIATDAGVAHFAVRGLAAGAAQAVDSGDPLRVLAEAMDYTVAPAAQAAEHKSDALFLARLLGLDEALMESAARWIR